MFCFNPRLRAGGDRIALNFLKIWLLQALMREPSSLPLVFMIC
jgi:hypothetical protein